MTSSFVVHFCFCFFKQKTAYEMRISDWSSDVCSSDLGLIMALLLQELRRLPILPLSLPFPNDRELARRCRRFVKEDRKSVAYGKECASTRRSRWSPYN